MPTIDVRDIPGTKPNKFVFDDEDGGCAKCLDASHGGSYFSMHAEEGYEPMDIKFASIDNLIKALELVRDSQ